MKTRNLRITTALPLCAVIVSSLCTAGAQTTAFTYQGRLVDGGSPANGVYALQVSAFDAPTSGNQLGATLTLTNNAVTNGLLTANLDFGSGVFTGPDRWLQIGVRPDGGTNAFTVLWPRQPLTPVPYAIYATLAGNVPTGTISSAQLAPNAVGSVNVQSNAITGSKIAAGQVVKSLNGLRDEVILVPGSGLSLNTSGNILQLSANVGNYWSVNGNSGTGGANFLGTLDNQPLELRVNNTRALRLEPNTNSPNVIGGFVGNSVLAGTAAATIGGGGTAGAVNTVQADYGFIGGGLGNLVQPGAVHGTISGGGFNTIQTNTYDSIVAGGWYNSIGSNSFTSVISGGAGNTIESDADDSTITGGRENNIKQGAYRSTISGLWNSIASPQATIGGGTGNIILTNANGATIAGGVANTNSGPQSTIAGGGANIIDPNAGNAVIGGGYANRASANNAAIIGGNANTANGNTATVGGGYLNAASGPGSFIGGGNQNQATAFDGTVGGGFQNAAAGDSAFVGGGSLNVASGYRAAIAGGMGNKANGDTSFIGAGNSNTAYTNSFIGAGYLNVADLNSVIGGGNQNVATNTWCVVGGGNQNKAIGYTSVVAGGIYNSATAQNAVVAGGQGNTSSGQNATVSGGNANTASGQYSVVPGGYNNAATNDFSFAAGRRAKANHQGAFVWADSADADLASTTKNQFAVRASGGVVFYSDPTAVFGAYLPPGGGAFSSLSDRNTKTNIAVVDGREVLERLAALPIATWNYKSQSESVRHMGAMAQDFAAAFGIGEDDRHISTVDADGVALAAIQGLNQKLQDELKRRDVENAELKARLEAMEKLLDQLSKK